MSFFAGNCLRSLIKSELFEDILTIEFMKHIIEVGENHNFEISSEALETFHILFKSKKDKEKMFVA